MTTIRQDVGELRAPVTTFAPTDRTQSRKLVLVSVAVILALNVYRSGREPGSLYKRLWGTGVLGVALSIVADFAPQVAGPFAMLVALGLFTRHGDEVMQQVTGRAARVLPAGVDVNPATNPRAAGPPAPTTPSPSARAGFQGGAP